MHNQKHLFDIPDNITYLNIAAQSPAFKAVYEAGLEGLKQKARPYTITGSDYFNPVIELKKLFAKLVDVDDYNRIATIPSVSYGMATVANNITLNAGDEILVLHEQFPSNIYSWKKLAKKYNATIKTITAPENKTITDKTAVIAMGNIHWSNGSLFDLKSISKKAKQHNALLIIDGSQSIGALPFSVKDIEPDALICAGYKWLFGPYGTAYAYLEWTPKTIQEYCKSITTEATKELKALGFEIEDENYRTHHLFGIKSPEGLDMTILKTALKEHNIFVSYRGDYIRLSCHLYNTKEDFTNLVNCITSVLAKA